MARKRYKPEEIVAKLRDRRRAGLGGRVHMGRLCRNLLLGRLQGELTAIYMSQAPSPIRAYYRKLVKQLVYGALTD